MVIIKATEKKFLKMFPLVGRDSICPKTDPKFVNFELDGKLLPNTKIYRIFF